MAHTHFVDVGKTQGYRQLAFAQVLFNLIDLAAYVTARPANKGQEPPFDLLCNDFRLLISHSHIIQESGNY